MRAPIFARGVGLAAVACGIAVSVHAGPPFLTDDPEPVDLRHAEVNVIFQQTRTGDGRAGALSGELNLGCVHEVQCHMAVPLAFDRADGAPRQVGLGDLELGLKYRFLHEDDSPWSAAVYPTLTLPTGNEGRGLGNGRAGLLLPLWVQRTLGNWNVDAGISWLANPAPGARNSVFAGLLVQRSFADRLSLGGEVYGRSSVAQGVPPSAGFNVGVIANVAPHQNILLSAGRALTGTETNHASMFVAYQLEH